MLKLVFLSSSNICFILNHVGKITFTESIKPFSDTIVTISVVNVDVLSAALLLMTVIPAGAWFIHSNIENFFQTSLKVIVSFSSFSKMYLKVNFT